VVVSRWERRNGASRLSRCKTFAYGPQIQARREARLAGVEEALLLGSDGNLSCGAAANLLVCMEGAWLTPPLSSGCLPGVMRARALAQGWLRERALPPREWERWEGALLINSLGARVVVECEEQRLGGVGTLGAEELWRGLI
jgi:branched-subunit amino acid aminotransferase/4-amino-4-deoxychorismate lyase